MITEIFVENRRLDISNDLSSLLTFAIDDIKDFAKRSTTFSKTVVLPGTANNNAIFGNIFEVGISNDYNPTVDNIGYNFNAAKSARCYIFQDNLQTFKGTLRLIQINKDKGVIDYEVALNGELTNLNVALTGAKLEDLDFSDYDGFLDNSTIIASWDNQGTGLYYPLADYGGYSTNKHDWQVKTFRPAIFVKDYIDRIFAAANCRYDSPFFETARFKSLIVPYNKKLLTRKDTDILKATITSTRVFPDFMSWDTISSLVFSLTNSNKHIEYTATPSISGTLSVTVSGNFKNADITVYFYKNGVKVLEKTYVYTGSGSFSQFFTYTQTLPNQTLATGDYYSCLVTLNNTTSGYDKNITLNTVEFFSDIAQDVEVDLFDPIVINDTLPINVRQIDFLTSIVKLFNLYITESQFDERLFHITPFVDFYSDESNVVDWTYKLNRDKPIKIIPLSELNAKIYNFKYADDGDFWNDLYKKRYNQSYGSYTYDSEFEFVSNSNTLELIFASTPLVGYAGEDKVYPTIIKKTGTTEEPTDCIIRIMQTKKVTGVTSWDILSGATVLNSLTYYGYAGHFDDPGNPSNDLNFGALKELFFALSSGNLTMTQFNVYWSTYMAEITDKDSKLLVGSFYLTPKDIFSLDFSQYIVVDGVLFRLNKITDYNATTPGDCQVELLKVINTSYSFPQPVRDISNYTFMKETYHATGSEGTTLTIPVLAGRTIIAIIREGTAIYEATGSPDSEEYTWSTPNITLGRATNPGERFLIIYNG